MIQILWRAKRFSKNLNIATPSGIISVERLPMLLYLLFSLRCHVFVSPGWKALILPSYPTFLALVILGNLNHHVIQNQGTFCCAPVTILNHGNKKARKLITCQRTEKNKQAIATHSKKHHGNVRQLCQKIS